MQKSLSIHPRNWPGAKGEKSNTSKPRKSGKYLRKMEAKLGTRRLTHAATVKGLPTTTPPTAYRTPGSMRLDKN